MDQGIEFLDVMSSYFYYRVNNPERMVFFKKIQVESAVVLCMITY